MAYFARGKFMRVRAMLLAASLAATGCGADPVRADLERYESAVLRPLAAEDARGAQAIDELTQATAKGRLDTRHARTTVRGELATRYHGLVTLLEAHHPTSPELLALHARLAAEYREITGRLDRAADALDRGDWRDADAQLIALEHRGFEAVRADFLALAARHGLEPTPEVPEK